MTSLWEFLKPPITLVVHVKHMKKSKWLDCQGNEFFPKQKGTPSLVKIEHKNTATLDSARSKKKYLKSQFCNYCGFRPKASKMKRIKAEMPSLLKKDKGFGQTTLTIHSG